MSGKHKRRRLMVKLILGVRPPDRSIDIGAEGEKIWANSGHGVEKMPKSHFGYGPQRTAKPGANVRF